MGSVRAFHTRSTTNAITGSWFFLLYFTHGNHECACFYPVPCSSTSAPGGPHAISLEDYFLRLESSPAIEPLMQREHPFWEFPRTRMHGSSQMNCSKAHMIQDFPPDGSVHVFPLINTDGHGRSKIKNMVSGDKDFFQFFFQFLLISLLIILKFFSRAY